MIRRIIWIDRKRCDGLGDCPPFYPQQAFRFETRKVHSANGQKNRKSGNRSGGGMQKAADMALHRNTKRLPVKMPVIGRQGEIVGLPI